MYIVYCPKCNVERSVKSRRKDEKGIRCCASCAKRIPTSTRSRHEITCPDCKFTRIVGRSTTSGFRLCRSCAAQKTSVRSNSPVAVQKRFKTLKRNGKLWSSKPEEQLYTLLKSHFGDDDVIHHTSVNGFRIDFYVKSIATYIQLDGLYWHGLDKPYEQLVGIPKDKFDRDRKCDKYFEQIGLRLVRITDKQLKSENLNVIHKIINYFTSQ